MTKKEKQQLKAEEQETKAQEEKQAMALTDPDRMDPRLAVERCSCGHKRILHFDAAWGMAKGHGSCAACKCTKFTWVASC